MTMKRHMSLAVIVVVSIVGTGVLAQRGAPTPPASEPLSSETRTLWTRTWNNIVGAAEAMPEEHYGYKPFAESMSFGQIVGHSADAAIGACSAFSTGQRRQLGAGQMTAKADLLKALAAAGTACETAYGALTDATAAQAAAGGFGVATRLGVLMGNTIHIEHEYAQMAIHLRMQGIVPPSSAGGGMGMGRGRGRGN
jgi:hypothetical protein